MKKIGKMFGKIFRHIGLFFDKWLITPITRILLKIFELGNGLVKDFDKVSGRKKPHRV